MTTVYEKPTWQYIALFKKGYLLVAILLLICFANKNTQAQLPNGSTIELYVVLEGATTPGASNFAMRTDLNARGLLPGQTPINPLVPPTPPGQPYNIPPWNYNGNETMITDAWAPTVVDWLLVSFRTDVDPSTEVAKTAAFLTDGALVIFPANFALDTSYDNTPLYIVIEHRSHIGIMSPTPVSRNAGGILHYDFYSQDSFHPGGGSGQKVLGTFLGNDIYGMFAGNFNQLVDGLGYDINATDKVLWSADNGIYDNYLPTDANLDGNIDGQDKILWSRNNGIFSNLPHGY